MHILRQSSLLLGLYTFTTALEITSPTGNSLDLSEPVIVAWSKPDPPNNNFVSVRVRMRFEMDLPEEDDADVTTFNEELAGNLSITSAGSIEWNPVNVLEALEEYSNQTELLRTATVQFAVHMVGRSWENGEIPAITEQFSLEGYDGAPPNAGALVKPGWMVLAVIGAVAQAWLL